MESALPVPDPHRAPPAGVAPATDEESDATVVVRVQNGDRDAFRLLVVRHRDALFRHARRMTGSGDVAADLVQASLVKAYTRLDECDPQRFGAWVFRIVANGCKDWLKNRRRKDLSLDPMRPGPHTAPEDPARDLDRAELRERLEGALARLPDAQREAFVLKHVEGMSYEEIADRVGGSVPALKMRVHRARDLLQELLEEDAP